MKCSIAEGAESVGSTFSVEDWLDIGENLHRWKTANQNQLIIIIDSSAHSRLTSLTEREASMVRTLPCFSYCSMIGRVDCRYVWILRRKMSKTNWTKINPFKWKGKMVKKFWRGDRGHGVRMTGRRSEGQPRDEESEQSLKFVRPTEHRGNGTTGNEAPLRFLKMEPLRT